MVLGSVSAWSQSTTSSTEGAVATSTTTAKAGSKIGLILAGESSNSIDAARTVGGTNTVSVVTLTYKVQDDLKLAATMVGEYAFAGRTSANAAPVEPTGATAPQGMIYRDFSLSASTTYGSFLGTEKTPVKYILNLPTSEHSRTTKQAFSVGAEIALSYDVTGKISSAVKLVPAWALKNGAADEIKNEVYGELRYAHTSAFSSYGFVDHALKVKTETALPKMKELAAVGVGLSYSPNKIMDLDLAVSRNRALFESAKNNSSIDFAFWDAKEISYTAAAVLKF